MSLPRVNPDTEDDAAAPARPEPSGPGRRWSVPEPRALPLPAIGALIFTGIRALSVAIGGFLLHHGRFAERHWSVVRWLRSSDGGHYHAIAVHGYAYPAGQLAHASGFSFFPGYPAVIDTIAWLPGVTVVAAGLIVTAIAGAAAAWGLTTLGLKLTADPRISLLMVAAWAVAPSATVLSMMFAEAMFCALAIWTLVALVSRRWLAAGGLTLVAGTVRSTVVALMAAVAVAALTAVFRAVRAGEPFTRWWRPLAAMMLAPLGLLGYLGYVALATRRLDGWFWIERQTFHMVFDGGTSTFGVVRWTLLGAPGVDQVLVVLAVIAGVVLMLWSLTERIPVYLHVYTVIVVVVAVATSANWLSSKPRFMLPAVLLALPVARLLAPVRTWVLVPLFVALTAATTWFGLYLTVIARWTP